MVKLASGQDSRRGKIFARAQGEPIPRVKISPGVVLFYPAPYFNALKINDL